MSERDVDDASYREIVAGLLEDGEQFAKSRIKLYRAVVLYRVSQARKAVGLVAIAFLIAAAALVALLMALVLSLSQVVGPLLAGIIVLLAAIQATRDERRFESALLHTLGAQRNMILRGIAVEFTALGCLAGGLAAFGAVAIGWVMADQIFP